MKMLREKSRYSQTEIANFLKISRQAYNNYERAIRMPDLDTITRLAEFFNVTTDYLLGKIDVPYPIELNIPEVLKDENVSFAFNNGGDYLTQEEVNELASFVEFLKMKRGQKG